jgi:hypothetical protein
VAQHALLLNTVRDHLYQHVVTFVQCTWKGSWSLSAYKQRGCCMYTIGVSLLSIYAQQAASESCLMCAYCYEGCSAMMNSTGLPPCAMPHLHVCICRNSATHGAIFLKAGSGTCATQVETCLVSTVYSMCQD